MIGAFFNIDVCVKQWELRVWERGEREKRDAGLDTLPERDKGRLYKKAPTDTLIIPLSTPLFLSSFYDKLKQCSICSPRKIFIINDSIM